MELGKDVYLVRRPLVRVPITLLHCPQLHVEFDKPRMPDQHKTQQNLIKKQQEDRRRDHFSHYILRLAYCRT